jgi:hypothetical protein
MITKIPFHDSLYRLAQIGDTTGVRLVRILSVVSGNRYTARAVEFGQGGATQFAEEGTMTVTNLAEPADQTGQVPADTDAVAIDVEGRWVVFLRQAAETGNGSPLFVAKVIDSLGGSAYTIREQVATGQGTFANKPGAAEVTACNLGELTLGPGAAVEDGAIVLVMLLWQEGNPPTARYVFDHPAYAKYLS